MNIREYIKDQTLLFDGAMGTYLMGKYHRTAEDCEKANIDAPQQVLEVHRAYLAVGCNAIKTNTFGANRVSMDEAVCRQVIEAGSWPTRRRVINLYLRILARCP